MKKGFERLCLPLTVYSLFLYVMSCTEEELDKTFFLFGGAIPSSIKSKFQNSYAFREYDRSGPMSSKIFRECIYWRYVKWFVVPRINKLRIYAQDHVKFCTYFIGKNNYTLLEDAPHGNSYMPSSYFVDWDTNRRQMRNYRFAKWFYGPVYGHSCGLNKQCTDLLMWKYDDVDFNKSKRCHIVDLDKVWRDCSDRKREFLKQMVDIDDSDLTALREHPLILLTQPIGRKDIVAHTVIYKSIAEKYPKSQLVIKTHPRDRFEYEKILPEYFIFRKPVPLQLLGIIGIRWKKAITVSSTSVLDFDYPIDIDWYGEGCGSLLSTQNPNFPIPHNAKLCSID